MPTVLVPPSPTGLVDCEPAQRRVFGRAARSWRNVGVERAVFADRCEAAAITPALLEEWTGERRVPLPGTSLSVVVGEGVAVAAVAVAVGDLAIDVPVPPVSATVRACRGAHRGLYRSNDRTIDVRVNEGTSLARLTSILAHEIGHAVDFEAGTVDGRVRFSEAAGIDRRQVPGWFWEGPWRAQPGEVWADWCALRWSGQSAWPSVAWRFGRLCPPPNRRLLSTATAAFL